MKNLNKINRTVKLICLATAISAITTEGWGWGSSWPFTRKTSSNDLKDPSSDTSSTNRESVRKTNRNSAPGNLQPSARTSLSFFSKNTHSDYLITLCNAIKSGSELNVGVINAQNANDPCQDNKTPLMVAVDNNKPKVVNKLIEKFKELSSEESSTALSPTEVDIGLYLDHPNPNSGKTALGYAIENVNVGIMQALIAAGADVKKAFDKDGKQISALLFAIGDDPAIKKDKDKNKNKNNTNGLVLDILYAKLRTATSPNPTFTAYKEKIQKLNLDLEQVDDLGKTALMYAIEKNHVLIMQALIAAGADVNKAFDKNGNQESALLFAIKNDKNALASDILHAKLKNATSEDPIFTAYQKKIQALNLDQVDALGKTALIYAIEKGQYTTENGQYNIANLLITAGANVNKVDAFGKTALIYAIKKGQYNIANLLITAGANVDTQNGAAIDSISSSPNKDRAKLLGLMLAKSKNPTKYNNYTWCVSKSMDASASQKACSLAYHQESNINSLNIESINANKNVNISHAIRHGTFNANDLEKIDQLQLDNQDYLNRTPLMHAIQAKNWDVAKDLINRGADVDLVINEDGLTTSAFSLMNDYLTSFRPAREASELAALMLSKTLEDNQSIEKVREICAQNTACASKLVAFNDKNSNYARRSYPYSFPKKEPSFNSKGISNEAFNENELNENAIDTPINE